ncbi:type III pantothenate kinase, partial [bacterium]|nr:type III pantothenate kinase [bacterium]
MAILCLDIGNTYAHWGLLDGQTVLQQGEVATKQFDAGKLSQLVSEHRPAGIALASVVPAVTA